VALRGSVPTEGQLHHPDRQRRKRRERVVQLAEAIERRRRGVERGIEVVDEWQDPRDRQLGGAVEVRVVGASVGSTQLLERGEGRVVITDFDRGDR
jgi:hypothetical protein